MYSLKLFGGASLEGPHGSLRGRAAQRQRVALLALLATCRSGAVPREKLIACLWPEIGHERGRHLLSNSIYILRQALGERAITCNGDALRLEPGVVDCDVRAFCEALAVDDLARAVELYSGPLLDGFYLADTPTFSRWLDEERERLALLHRGALEALAEQRERDGDPRAAVECWRKVAAHDPYSPRVALRLMSALEAAGDSPGALQHARVHEILLATELEVAPDQAVSELAHQIRKREVARTETGRKAAAEEPRAGDGSAAADAPAERSEPVRYGWVWRPVWVALAVLAVVAVVKLAPAVRQPDSGEFSPSSAIAAAAGQRSAGVDARSVAVLPFANLSKSREHEYFSDGMTDELITTLARMEGLRVAARTSVFRLKGRDLSIEEVGELLQVAHVLEGSVRRSGERVRISVQLVNASTGFPLWTETFDRDLTDIFSVQHEIARAIAGALAIRIGSDLNRYPGTSDPEAYDLYLQGRYHWNLGSVLEPASQQRVLTLYRRAIERDPNYVLAHAGIADAYSHAGDAPRAKAAALRAVSIDSTSAEARAAHAYVLAFFEWRWEEAERELDRALELDPSYVLAYLRRANVLAAMGRSTAAIADVERAAEREPLSFLVSYNRGLVHYWAGQYEEAVRFLRHTLAMDSSRSDVRRELADAHFGRGDLAEAAALYRSVADPVYSALVSADVEDVRRAIRWADANPERVSPVTWAKLAARVGDTDLAFHWLERAVHTRDRWLPFHLRFPAFAELRSDPRFTALNAQMRLAEPSAFRRPPSHAERGL
jgi:adenylate cyclase